MTERAEDSTDFRVHVVRQAIELFSEHGYESTTVDQIAAAAGVSRRTFFRQFRSKEDVIFADHEALLADIEAYLHTSVHADPWAAVCDAAEMVFAHFRDGRDLSLRRYRVVQKAPALRERELVTGYRYERLFTDYLRSALPGEPVLHVVGFAAAVTACHNHLLRAMIRGDASATAPALHDALVELRHTYRVAPRPEGHDDEIVVVRFPAGTAPDDVAAAVRGSWGR
ncbi:TetR family transcriptional regulator [Rhodococcus rhodnii]|uniref:TetR family transcriptional regulator n=2 Tax=Rhodococcus rhodnii TaxID=38312 RepID=R7WJ79_9NOCA|nr:TetR family transcriptional regulator [Rhodococcus rhodnii]EOM75318.1 TetR family transcriptional regulator [Rhodococcus rhodnii LMG 5362]TXG89970.1 TetR family transcriptional regulator [Rhodococcus rhodnii]